ncbi:MAG TPA: dihydrofolate reductase [Polyangiaceae bacterium]|jgi:dihydrofolate reductase|nr:dihydrofolate reductase [Polyangiaceae bacterium]
MKPLCLVFAMSDARVIGKGNALPWRIPEDLRHFKSATMGHAVISGRKTYDSVGKPLPGRRNIVITRNASLEREGAEVTTTLAAALDLAYATDAEPIILGGSEIFAMALPIATKMIVTFVHRDVDGDALFPEIDWSEWTEVWRRKAETEPDVEFAEFTRKT